VFTGIVEELGRVTSAQPGRLTVAASETLRGMVPGSSIAVNGVCLTITTLDGNAFLAEVTPETLRRSNLGRLRAGDSVNLERPLALGGQLGGHLVEGHVDATGRVASIALDGEALIVGCEAPAEVMRYIVEKGFIAVDGVSLTVVARHTGSFEVSVIDYTRQHTTLGNYRVGDLVNLEVDIIAKYVEQLMPARNAGVTVGLLREHGFV
jgi:riboflavin synthase